MQLMSGRRGLIMGVANDHSIAWGIARTLAGHGAGLAFTFQNDTVGKRVRPLAASVNSELVLPCDVENYDSVKAVFSELKDSWGEIDFIVHAIAFSDRNELRGRYADTSRDNFCRTMMVSCFSFTEVARLAAEVMNPDGVKDKAMLTLTYDGANRVMPNYNVMGVAKAALETSVRYLASDYGADNIRVNAISAGPVRTLAGAGIADARGLYNYQKHSSPLRRNINLTDIGGAALYMLSPLSSGVTGEVHYVDSGFNTIGVPKNSITTKPNNDKDC